MKNILLFGATGDIGRYFAEYFLDNYSGEEYRLIALGRRDTDFFEKLGIQYIKCDISKKEDFALLPKDVYAVVDLAGLMPARMSGYDPVRYLDTNIYGTFNILEFCRENKVDRIIFSQSFGEIKDHAEKELYLRTNTPREFSLCTDHSVYVMTKNFAIDLIENYYQMYGIKRFIFRMPTIYLWSPIDHFYLDGVIRWIGFRLLIEKARKGETLEVWGDPYRKKDMIYIKDLCQMMFKALFVNDKVSGYYNAGTGIGTTLIDQIKGIAEVFNPEDKKSEIVMCPEKTNAPQYIMDITEAVNELGYTPKYSYIEMLKDMKLEMEKQG